MFNIRGLRWLFSLVLASIFVIANVSGPSFMGVSRGWSDESYHFAAGTAPWELALAAVICVLYFLLVQAPSNIPGAPLPGIVRRYFAFLIDFILVLMAYGPIIGIVPVLVESRRTHEFEWSFARDVPASTDAFLANTGVLLLAIVMIFYFAFPLMRGKPTPGTCVAGYQVLADDGNPLPFKTAVFRTLLGFVAVCSGILAPLLYRDRELGKFWLDKVFNTHAVKPR